MKSIKAWAVLDRRPPNYEPNPERLYQVAVSKYEIFSDYREAVSVAGSRDGVVRVEIRALPPKSKEKA